MSRVKRDAGIVIVGGGIIGCSIAYHLAAMGRRDVVLIEKNGLTEGATWHAAGLVGQLRSARDTTRMLQSSVELYDRLEAETGLSIGWHKTGSLRLASSKARLMEIKNLATMAGSFGLEMHLLSAHEARELFPPMSVEGVEAAAFIPSDGYIDPSGVTLALAKGARTGGVEIVQGERVEKFSVKNRRITEIITDKSEWRCDIAALATGMWTREFGFQLDARIPACALEHQYIVTEPIDGVHSGLPTLRDPDLLVYYKPDSDALAVGGYEDNPPPFGADGIPADFTGRLLADDYNRFAPLAERATHRTPALATAGVKRIICGPIPYSADSEFVMGRLPEYDNAFVAAGFLYGIAAGGGVGKMMAEWICTGAPSLDLYPCDVRRFVPHQNTKFFLYRRAVEHYAYHYKFRAPGEQWQSARNLRRSPLFYPLQERGARYIEKAGWERPAWFLPSGEEEQEIIPYRRPAGFVQTGAECHAARERAALFDLSSFSKLEVCGRGARRALDKIAAGRVGAAKVGKVVYTQLCNEKGGIEADVTVTRVGDDEFYIVTGAGFGIRDFAWIQDHLPTQGIFVRDVSSAFAVISLSGPRARDILAMVTEEEVSAAAFPFSSYRQLTIGAASVRALRIGYTGELGYELHIPSEFAGHVYEVLRAAGETFGVIDAGYNALESLRLEKGYVYWSHEVGPTRTPWEAGLGGLVALDKKADFIGKDALARQKAEGINVKLCLFAADTDALLMGGETIICDDETIGPASSAGYAHYTGQNLAMGYLPRALWEREDFTLEVRGERYPLRRLREAVWDSSNLRLRG